MKKKIDIFLFSFSNLDSEVDSKGWIFRKRLLRIFDGAPPQQRRKCVRAGRTRQ